MAPMPPPAPAKSDIPARSGLANPGDRTNKRPMTIQVGDTIPDIKLHAVEGEAVREISMAELCAGQKLVLFAMVGAFTDTCQLKHLPGLLPRVDALRAAGADRIAVLAVNDASVMKAWADSHGVGDRITMLADGAAAFTLAMGLQVDLGFVHMGMRSQRYAAIVDDGVVTALHVEKPLALEVSTAEAMLEALKG